MISTIDCEQNFLQLLQIDHKGIIFGATITKICHYVQLLY